MSTLVIASHVKEGIELAKEMNLPQELIDIIPQHHGTKLITYFYEKAKMNHDPELGEVSEDEYRYPGPKPQTKEAGSSRSPTPSEPPHGRSTIRAPRV
jgi:membrane-associated HD superfamily phosphohydrolase